MRRRLFELVLRSGTAIDARYAMFVCGDSQVGKNRAFRFRPMSRLPPSPDVTAETGATSVLECDIYRVI